jgi:ectoine hydroxylase-related dioxygenase (phytanoyl-CoA dioxygenase family)
MYAVPLCADPGYPADLGRTDAPLEAVRGLPIADGDLLFWNANLLHWGGASSAFSHTQRRSVTVTLVERSAFLELRRATPLASATARERIDGIARQICIYGHVPPAVADWARFTVAARR